MKSKPFTGKVGQMKADSPWLASEDFLGMPPVKLTISEIRENHDVKMEGGRTEDQLFSVHFKGSKKGMILNATNRRTLSTAYGADTKNWIGKEVFIAVKSGIRKPGGRRGETCNGLRLHVEQPEQLVPQGNPFAATSSDEPDSPGHVDRAESLEESGSGEEAGE